MQNNIPPYYKWLVLSITTIGVLMVAIDIAVVILAIPDIMTELHSNLVHMVWVLMAYIFVSTVLLLALGRVADIYGRVRLYNAGFALFTLGSALCGFAMTDRQLIAARVVQGGGGALMLVNSWAIVTETFPPHQVGTAMGINSMTFGLGGVIGPVLGGFILSFASWRWIFLINIPLGVAGTYFGYRYLRQLSPRRTGEHLDLVGAGSFSVSLFSLLLALTEGIELGWTSTLILALFTLFILSLAFFILWERNDECPALDLDLFHNRVFDFSVLSAMFQSLAIFAVQFLVVFYLQAVKGDSALTAALLLLPMPLGLALVGPFSGRLSDRIGARIPATIGLIIQAAGVYILSNTSIATGYHHIALGLALTGIGGGLFFSPNTSAAMRAAEQHSLGVAAATLATLRNTGMVISFAVALAVAAGSLPQDVMLLLFIGTPVHLKTPLMGAFVHGMNAALQVSMVICLVAAFLSSLRGREERRATGGGSAGA